MPVDMAEIEIGMVRFAVPIPVPAFPPFVSVVTLLRVLRVRTTMAISIVLAMIPRRRAVMGIPLAAVFMVMGTRADADPEHVGDGRIRPVAVAGGDEHVHAPGCSRWDMSTEGHAGGVEAQPARKCFVVG